MSILTKKQILDRVAKNEIGFNPNLDKFQLQAHAVDLRLGYTFLIPKIWHLTTKGREILDVTHFDKANPQQFDVVELEQGQYFD